MVQFLIKIEKQNAILMQTNCWENKTIRPLFVSTQTEMSQEKTNGRDGAKFITKANGRRIPLAFIYLYKLL
jgi:hypothetical protein